jgi:putative membrane protein
MGLHMINKIILRHAFHDAGPPSHILWNIKYDFFAVMAISGALIALQTTGNIAPFEQFATFLRIISFAMSLMLSYRLNRAYDRWWEARKCFAGIGSSSTALAIQATTFLKDRPALLENFRRWTILWAFSVKQVLEDRKELDPIAAELLYEEELAVYKASRKGRQVVVTKLYQLVDEAALPDEATAIMLETIANGVRSSGDCTRIHYQAMPIGVSLACGGFIQIWCYLLPFGAILDLSSDAIGQWWFLPSPVVGSLIIQLLGIWLAVIMLLGIDEITNQLEHPYHLLPLEALALTYHRDINRVLQESTDLKLATQAGMRRTASEAEAAARATPSDLPATPTAEKQGEAGAPISSATSPAFGLTQRIMHLHAYASASPRRASAREVPCGESEFDDYLDSPQWQKLSDWRDAVLAESLPATGMSSGGVSQEFSQSLEAPRAPSHLSRGIAAGFSSFESTRQLTMPQLLASPSSLQAFPSSFREIKVQEKDTRMARISELGQVEIDDET